jgi:hypothetical protein
MYLVAIADMVWYVDYRVVVRLFCGVQIILCGKNSIQKKYSDNSLYVVGHA